MITKCSTAANQHASSFAHLLSECEPHCSSVSKALSLKDFISEHMPVLPSVVHKSYENGICIGKGHQPFLLTDAQKAQCLSWINCQLGSSSQFFNYSWNNYKKIIKSIVSGIEVLCIV